MQFSQQQKDKYLLVSVSGRLDASWAEHFLDTFREYVRQGQHHILLDAKEMTYLSSAGIRALVQVSKIITTVKGSFQILEANSFVIKTLTMTGFQSWLIAALPADLPVEEAKVFDKQNEGYESYLLDNSASLTLSIPAEWKPWKPVTKEGMVKLCFDHDVFSLGIGMPDQAGENSELLFGEFLSVAGNVVYQPPREADNPDFLLAEKDYVPEMQCIQALYCKGNMSHLMRFAPTDRKRYFGIGELVEKVLSETKSQMTAFVMLAEVDGLVGSTLIKSPGTLKEEQVISFPELKEWLSFCGERVHSRHQALLFGVAIKNTNGQKPLLLQASKLNKNLFLHVHAAVFPYQPIESGIINMKETIKKILNGPSPLALYHLIEDSRPATGLGESAFVRGVCWFAPLKNFRGGSLWE